MKIRCLLFFCLFSAGVLCMAQDSIQSSQSKKSFWDRSVGRLLKRVDNKSKEWEASGVDTFVSNYRMYLFGSSSGLKMADHELDMQLNLGWRF